MYFLADIGGTKTRLIWCESEKDLKDSKKLKILATPKSYKEFLELLKNFVDVNHLRQSVSIPRASAVIFGFAGMFDEKKEKLIYTPNLRDFENKPLKRDLEKILKSKVILENDAVLAGLGEGKFGAGKNFGIFGYITLSTGIGGAKIITTLTNTNFNELMRTNERPRTGANYNNREPIRTDMMRTNTNNENRKPIRNDMMRTNVNYSELMRADEGSQKFAVDDNDVRNGSPLSSQKFAVNYNLFGFEPGHSFLLMNNFLFEVEELLGGENIKKFFGKSPEDIKSKKFWNYYHKILSIFLINISIFWSVDKIILGGGIIKSLSFKKLILLVNKLHPLPIKIKIIESKLGDMNVLYGGLVLKQCL